jgi:threonine dehydratase
MEIVAQASRMNTVLDALLVCCSGGGLMAGSILALNALSPVTAAYAVEPLGFEKMSRSVAAGRQIDNPPGGRTICDALSGPYTAAIPFRIVKSRLAGAIAVTDNEVKEAMREAFGTFGLAVEPGAAAAFAAALSGRFSITGKTVAVTITGRNVDLDLAARILGEAPEPKPGECGRG